MCRIVYVLSANQKQLTCDQWSQVTSEVTADLNLRIMPQLYWLERHTLSCLSMSLGSDVNQAKAFVYLTLIMCFQQQTLRIKWDDLLTILNHEHQEELKSVKTEFIKEESENMSDPEPCRMKHTEDPEEQRGWCLFFIHATKVSISYKCSYFELSIHQSKKKTSFLHW